jgi:hypothetical protein
MKIPNIINKLPKIIVNNLDFLLSLETINNPLNNCWHPNSVNIIGNATFSLTTPNKKPIGNSTAIIEMAT